MQQIQYHGIASYKFEYQLSTGGDWTTAVTTPSTATSYAYTIEGLTAGTGYNLRVTVTDNAGNSGTGNNTGTTKKPEKNPGGVIEDITTGDLPTMGTDSGLTVNGISKRFELVSKEKTLEYSWVPNSTKYRVTFSSNSDWFLLAQDNDNYYLVSRRS